MSGQGEVVGIFVSETAETLPLSINKVRAIAKRGLETDRYFQGTGTFSTREGSGRQLTLIEEETLQYVRDTCGISLSGEESRRNIVTRQIDLNELVGHKFLIGAVLVEGTRLCHPCKHLEKLTGKKLLSPLKDRGGLRANILTDGTISIGDPIGGRMLD